MKKVILVDASPRQGGNCDVITEQLTGELPNVQVKVFRIRDHSVHFCKACDACKTKNSPQCVQKDDMGALIPELDTCDAVVLLSPIYFNQLCAQAKTFLDRTYCFFNPSKKNASIASKRGKKAAVICVCGGGSVDDYTKVASETAKAMSILGVDENRVYVCGGVNAPGSCKEQPECVEAVGKIAKWLSE